MLAISNLFEFNTEEARKNFWNKQASYATEKQPTGSVSEKEQNKILKNTQLESAKKYPK